MDNYCNCLKLDVWCPVAAVAEVTRVTAIILENSVTPGTAAAAATGHHTSSCRSCRVSCRMGGQLDVLPALAKWMPALEQVTLGACREAQEAHTQNKKRVIKKSRRALQRSNRPLSKCIAKSLARRVIYRYSRGSRSKVPLLGVELVLIYVIHIYRYILGQLESPPSL